jgi:hypothetical protein
MNIDNVFILRDIPIFNFKHYILGCSKTFRFVEAKAKYKKNKTYKIAAKREV